MDSYGILSITPPLLVIVLAIWTKKTLFSLIVGTYIGSVIINGWNPLVALPKVITDYITPSLLSDSNIGSLILVTVAGGFVYLIKTSGMSRALGEFAGKHLKNRKQAQLATSFAGFALIYTEPCFTLGVIMRPVSEKFKVARVKLAYIIDSMGCNLASMSPICSYGPYIAGLIATQLAAANINRGEWSVYAEYVSYNFYGIFAILTVWFVAFTGLDVGKMYIAEQRAIKTGRLIAPTDHPIVIESKDETELPPEAKVTLANFLIPIGTLFVTIIAMILYTGDIAHNSLVDTFLNSSITTCIITGMCTGSIACALMAHKAKVFKLSQAMDKFIKGVVDMTEVNLILVMAWALSAVIGEMDLKGFIAQLIVDSSFPPVLVPAVVFIAGAFVAFSTGSSWGTWAIMIPIAVPIAIEFNFPIALAVAGAIGGGLFGDQCSPISDTTILASTASGSDHVQHVATQLPYALTVAASAFVGFVVTGLTGIHISGFIATAICIVIGIFVLSKIAKKQAEKDLDFSNEILEAEEQVV